MLLLKNILKRKHSLTILFFVFSIFHSAVYSFAKNVDRKIADTLVHRDIKQAQQLLTNAKPGDTIFLKGGIYFLKDESLMPVVSGKRNAWITIMPYSGEEVIIDGTHYLDSVSKTGNNGGAPHKGTITFENIHYIRLKSIAVRQSHALGIC